jgi:deazaflavin-dependent oxidoreductase (nitroreductase family)
MTDVPDRENWKTFNDNVANEFRANGGKVSGPFAGTELLLLTTTGAKSGQPRLSPLGCLHIDGKLLIIAGYGGADINPAWVHNLRANPRAHVEVGTESFDVLARELPPAERNEIVPKFTAVAPVVAELQAKTSRVFPIFELQNTPDADTVKAFNKSIVDEFR